MVHLWVRAEQRPNEERVGITPAGAAALIARGFRVTVEESGARAIPIDGYRDAGCEVAPEGTWPDAPNDAIILGLKELPEDGTPLRHRHIMFGHAFKGQHSGQRLLRRFRAGGGTLYDLEYLVDADGRRVAAFGYWAGYAGAAVSLMGWAAQANGAICPPVDTFAGRDALLSDLGARLDAVGARPTAIVIGALGRVGTGASDLCAALGVSVTKWDMAETAQGGPFPQILDHDLFINCILARPGTPVFVPQSAVTAPRRLSVIGDVACDPDSDYNPVPVYHRATTWAAPVVRVHDAPPLDVMAIDNLPSLLPREASEDFAGQLLPHLLTLDALDSGVWGRARAVFDTHIKEVRDMTIHWCGTGLSAIPGLRRLIEAGHDVAVWNRSTDKAQAAVGDLTDKIHAFDRDALAGALAPGDVVVSMLPGDWHVPLAELCLSKGAHFVSSSYIAPEMRALDAAARDRGLSLVNEIGLDPGIDHLMAHHLVADYRASGTCDAANELSFTSYCGGVPKLPNAFRYKFSWSPLGVLKALRSPSRSIRDFAELNVARPWNSLSSYDAPLPTPETFEVYPNRDSIPFIADYRFDPDWRIRDFVRGTLRLNGWAEAWRDVFAEIETLEGEAGEARLREMSDQFWQQHAYAEGEPDRVVLCVGLRAERDGAPVWHKTYVLDAWGDARGTAMARLVSVPVSLAVESVLAREIPAGVSPAPHDPRLVARYLAEVDRLAQHLQVVDHLA